MNQPKIIFFDIDETLYIKDQKLIPASITEQVLPRLKAKGIIPAIASGRAIGAFPEALKPLLNPNGFEVLVTINGQYNCYGEKLISHYPLNQERIEEVITKLNELSVIYASVSRDEIGVSRDHEMVRQALKPIKDNYAILPDLHLKSPIYQMLAFFPESDDKRVFDSGVLGDDLKTIRWHKTGIDLLNKNNAKSVGIQDVLNYFGLTLQDTMAFGDGLNDIEMLSEVGCGVAMGNAEPELKAVADFVTLPIEQDGILYALEKLGVI